jgi:hypothetical protein
MNEPARSGSSELIPFLLSFGYHIDDLVPPDFQSLIINTAVATIGFI